MNNFNSLLIGNKSDIEEFKKAVSKDKINKYLIDKNNYMTFLEISVINQENIFILIEKLLEKEIEKHISRNEKKYEFCKCL